MYGVMYGYTPLQIPKDSESGGGGKKPPLGKFLLHSPRGNLIDSDTELLGALCELRCEVDSEKGKHSFLAGGALAGMYKGLVRDGVAEPIELIQIN
jgi:hypothetical protein